MRFGAWTKRKNPRPFFLIDTVLIEAISLLRFEHHHEGRAGIIAKAGRSC